MQVLPIQHRRILSIAIPIMLAHFSEPLIGLVDTWVMGQLEDPKYIGAIALGALIFSFVFWGFGFLRMSTSGYTAQACGSGDTHEQKAILLRALLLGLICGVALIILQNPIIHFSFLMIDGSAEVERLGANYVEVRIWSAPFALISFCFTGWLVGKGYTLYVLFLHLLLNICNVVLSLYFVLTLKMGVEGVALASVLSTVISTLAGMFAIYYILKKEEDENTLFFWIKNKARAAVSYAKMRDMLGVNRDIMIRTLCLTLAFAFFTAQAAKFGDVALAATAVLMQFMSLTSHLLDSFATAAEVLVGNAIGAKKRDAFKDAVIQTSLWAFAISLVLSLMYFVFGGAFIAFLTKSVDVQMLANDLLVWTILAPVISVGCFQLDGIFIGATRGKDMRNMMLISFVVYISSWWVLAGKFGIHGMWIALLIFLALRGVTLLFRLPKLYENAFDKKITAKV